MPATKREYGKISTLETIGLVVAVLATPLVQGLRLLLKPFSELDAPRSWRRVKAESAYSWLTKVLNTSQIQFADKSTQAVFEKWAPTVGVKPDVETIEEGAQLLWATPRKRKSVLLYIHGGGYCLPSNNFSLPFWNHVTKILNDKGKDVSYAALEYTLVPAAHFPTQLRQGAAAIKHLVNSGYKAEDIYVVADSAGTGVFLQSLSHALHPLPGVPEFSIGGKLGGIILISPYASLETTSSSFVTNAHRDIFPVSFFEHLAEQVLPGVPEDKRTYVECGRTPEDWWKGADNLISRALITGGANECLKADIEVFVKNFSAVIKDTNYINIPRGTHNECYDAFLSDEPTPGEWPPLMANWLAESMA